MLEYCIALMKNIVKMLLKSCSGWPILLGRFGLKKWLKLLLSI